MQEPILNEAQDDVMTGFKLVQERQRPNFLPSITQNHYLKLENAYLSVLTKCVPSYSGGYHEFIEFANGAKTPVFDITNDKKVEVVGLMNHYAGEMTYRAASLCAFIIACNHLGNSLYEAGDQRSANGLIENYQKLMDTAWAHEMFAGETSQMAAFLD